MPAVASHGVPVVLTNTGSSPPGGATTVVEPLSSTHAPNSVAASRACSSRRASTSAGSLPSSRPSSPACGVSSVGAGRGSRSLRRASSASPSASTSTGRLVASTAASRAAASSVVPMPGPATHACTRPTPAGNSFSSSERTRPSVSSSVITTSGKTPRTAAAAPGAVTSRTMPAPPRTAPPVESRAAPVNRSLPASRPSTPRRYLSDSLPGCGSSARMSSRCGALTSGRPSRCGPSPMSTSSTTPAWPAPGSISSPGLTAPNVTVTSARTAGPSTSPVSASMPLGRSTATVTPAAPAARCASVAYGSRSPPRPPVPSIPSTIRSARPITRRASCPVSYLAPVSGRVSSGSRGGVTVTTRPPCLRSAAAPPGWIFWPAWIAVTAAPRPASSAPAYSASPPLSPVPASTATRAP